MAKLSLEHINNLRAQLLFLNETLDATDHNAPDWLATDLISLRNKSGRLQDEMKRFRDQLESEGLGQKKVRTSNKRLSIEGAKLASFTPASEAQTPKSHALSPSVDQSPTPRAKATQAESTYLVQHVDVTEEVNKRLQESRLRRLMQTPSTAQKRKYDTYEDEPRSGGPAGTDEEGPKGAYSGSEFEKTPTKRLKSSGTFEQVGKRQEDGPVSGFFTTMATPNPIQNAPLPPEQRLALEQQQRYERITRNLAIGGLVMCPIIALLPPRKLDLYTFSLGIGFYLSADHLATLRTGRGLVQNLSPLRTMELPTERARETQKILQEEREKSKKALEKKEGQEKGILGKLWMGDEEEGWKEKRLEEEKKALEEGRGYGDLIFEQIWDVWNWDKKKGKNDDSKKEMYNMVIRAALPATVQGRTSHIYWDQSKNSSMFQPSTPFDDTTSDPFLPSHDLDKHLSQSDFQGLFGSNASDRAAFSASHNELPDGLDFTYGGVTLTPVASSNPSTVLTTPDFSTYSFSQQSPTYPTPGSGTPYPYPAEFHQTYETVGNQQAFSHRPLSVRSHTNNAHIHPTQPSPSCHRRRSLSHGDAEHIAATSSRNNPTFVRLQAPRAKTTTAEEHRRNRQYSQYGRSTSQGPLPRGRPMKPTSMPYSLHSSPLVGGMLPTPIGTPLNEVLSMETDPDTSHKHQDYSTGIQALRGFPPSEGPVFRHMLRPEELSKSRQIIEIGALAVTNRTKIDPKLGPHSHTTNHERILKKLNDIEEHLKNSERTEGLRGCGIIREALANRTGRDELTNVVDEVLDDHTDEPSRMLAMEDLDMFDGCDDNEIMAMLMRQNGVDDSGIEDGDDGSNEPWTRREDENALLLNISLPYDSAHLSINNAPLLSPDTKVLPRIYVNQVLQETSKDDISSLIQSNQLDSLGGGYFGLSYSYTLRRIQASGGKALVFHFDMMELWTDLTSPPLTVILDKAEQKMVELVLLQRPLLSPGDPASAFEIIRAKLIPRASVAAESGAKRPAKKVVMWFHDWDTHGKKGTATHIVNSASSSFITYLSSGALALFVFVFAVIALFVLVCLFVIFGCGWWNEDDYEIAQHGKKNKNSSTSGAKGVWGGKDIEAARRFMSPEELGVRGSGRVVGVGHDNNLSRQDLTHQPSRYFPSHITSHHITSRLSNPQTPTDTSEKEKTTNPRRHAGTIRNASPLNVISASLDRNKAKQQIPTPDDQLAGKMAITNTSSTVQGIFALHVVTAGGSIILLLAAIALFIRQLAGGPGRPRAFMKFLSSTDKRHSATGTHLFLISGLFCLMIAYATQSAIVALQSRLGGSPFYITSAYSYPHYTGEPFGNNESIRYGKIISILSFTYQCAMILMNTSIVGAIWIHANHVQNNGTGIKEPGFLSWVWNAFWMVAILALGFASWAVGLARRGSGNDALAYPTQIDSDYTIRTLYVTYVAVVIAASTSVTLEAVLCWIGIRKNGVPGNHSKSALTRFVMLVTPIVWVRNAFSIAQIVLIYYDVTNWSRTTNQALAFLFIIFGELCDLGILALVLLGAWSFGRKEQRPEVVKEGRYSESVRDDVIRDDVVVVEDNRGTEYVGGPVFEDGRGPTYVPHVGNVAR
ncbi:hypothetical protein TW65_07696 [Stemphylium lycopersici]|nr:hypothetical protein TW65_07696 [Stemphylium lycopersici]